jgi:hypothetical protein
MTIFIYFTSLFFAFTAFASTAKVTKPAAENISAEYLRKLISESKELKAFQENFKKNPKTFCPQYNGPDESTCLKAYLLSTEIHSSSQAVLLSALAASTGVNDKKVGYSSQMTRIMMLENVIVLFERVDVNKFYLAKMNPKTPEGKLELKELKKSDERMLADSFKKMQTLLVKALAKVENNRAVANVEEWKKNKIADLKVRLERLKKNSWKYPN